MRETGFAQTTYYVDGGWGSNSWDGLTAVYTNGHGPKLNVSNTISAASSSDTLSIAPGFYQEFTWNPGANSVTLIPQGLVTIYDTNPATTDSDGDGMPDQWEAKYGLNGFDPDDADDDADNDTITNLTEYQQGTDPTNPDTTPPTLTATITPTPNANGWNTNNVLVEFSAVDNESGVAYVTPNVTVTNEVVDLLVEGMAIDAAGNRAFDAVVVRIDKNEPTVTGNPGDGDIINSLRPPFVIQYSDVGSSVDELSLDVVLDGTNNVTTNFIATINGAIWVPTNDLAIGSHTWQITVADLAGHEIMAEATFTITTNAALISNLNLPDGATMPDVEAVWVQGKRDDTNTVVSYSVNFGSPKAFNARWDQFGMLVPLDFGTNIVEITGSKAGTNTSMALTVIRTDRYRAKLNAPSSGDFVMDGPAMGYFANGQPQTVSGYVSLLNDENLPSESPIESVSVNNIGASLGSPDQNGNVPFTTTNSVNVSTNFTSATVTICYSNGPCYTIPLGVWEGYFVRQRDTTRQDIYYDFSTPAPVPCPQGGWWVDYPHREIHRYLFSTLLTDTNEFAWTENYFSQDPQTVEQITKCQSQPDVPAIEWEFWHNSGESSGYTTQTGRGLRFGYEDGYAHEYVDYNFDEVLDSERIMFGHNREDEGWLTFVAPIYYGTATPVIFTFEGVDYARTNALDLTQVTYKNQAPVVTNGTQVGYLITVNGGQEYTITEGDFDWPAGYTTATTNYFTEGYAVSHSMQDWFSFGGFHNASIKALKRVQVDRSANMDKSIANNQPPNVVGSADTELILTVETQPPGREGEVVVVIESTTGDQSYNPGTGTISRDQSNPAKWVYTPFTEPKTQKHPKSIRVTFVAKFIGNAAAGATTTVSVKPVFTYLATVHDDATGKATSPTEADYNKAWQYAKWKYDIDISKLTSVGYADREVPRGQTASTIFGSRACTLGRSGFRNENICASTLLHENLHGSQSYSQLTDPTRGPDNAEAAAYLLEIQQKAHTGVDSVFVEQMLIPYYKYYRGLTDDDPSDD